MCIMRSLCTLTDRWNHGLGRTKSSAVSRQWIQNFSMLMALAEEMVCSMTVNRLNRLLLTSVISTDFS